MMAERRRAEGDRSAGRPRRGARRADGGREDEIRVRPVPGTNEFELAYPACVRRRQADLEEVRKMLEAGEVDIAEDELRWLLVECRALLEAHKLLGEIALADGDLELARGHLGYAYDMGRRALPEDGLPGTLPCARPANRAFFEAGKGLVQALGQLGQREPAAEVVRQLLALDPSDPLDVAGLLPVD